METDFLEMHIHIHRTELLYLGAIASIKIRGNTGFGRHKQFKGLILWSKDIKEGNMIRC